MNDDDQCFPNHYKCPNGFHSHEDDESDRCIPDDKDGNDNGNNYNNNGGSNEHKTVSRNCNCKCDCNCKYSQCNLCCSLEGIAAGTRQAFDMAKYQAWGLHTNGQKAYYRSIIYESNLLVSKIMQYNVYR